MGQIVCSTCNSTVEFFEDEKVTILYSVCPHCGKDHNHEDNEN
ncbi:GapA-binding peptide SR1P [Pallidibacillus pasinlerensis]|uniref:GapA-binding peptide SR1P n=1 Tax=Pallidibacillus pasinlerensis TaxID=2703818 RepID=A0ABX0A3J5_9BACI|nr:GapA-binding peptide SR1P [Pallidibacillus pasinlerensis]NCU17076.1 GapA-binding peptide SR1P [Pallidibacillus pasinlerensis]